MFWPLHFRSCPSLSLPPTTFQLIRDSLYKLSRTFSNRASSLPQKNIPSIERISIMAAAVGSYPSHAYYRPTYSNSTLPLFYHHVHSHSNRYHHQAAPQEHHQTTTPLIQSSEYIDSISPPLRRRREPRIRRQVIMLPTPEPIYRQVRHRLPTPERGLVKRTVIQKANGDFVVQQERHRKKTRSHSRTTRSSRPRHANAD